jgi:hypothetical protein
MLQHNGHHHAIFIYSGYKLNKLVKNIDTYSLYANEECDLKF